jgi:hypothetical protein
MRVIILISAALLSACASSYHPLRPNSTYFPATDEKNSVVFSYKLGVLREMGNKKYAKREDKKAIRVASVKLTNNTSRDITIGKDVIFQSANSEAVLLAPEFLHKELKQGVAIYLLYLLLTGDQGLSIIIGPGIAIGNMAGAGAANQNFLKELKAFNMINKTIKPGETVYGLIGFRDIGYAPLSLKFLNQVAADN